MNGNDMEKIALEMCKSNAYLIVNKNLILSVGPRNAVYLGNLIDKFQYFQDREMLQEDRSFFLTYEDQRDQLGLSDYQIRECKKTLVGLGVIQTRMKGTPPKEFYKINFRVLFEKLMVGSSWQTKNEQHLTDGDQGIGRELEENGGNEISGENHPLKNLTSIRKGTLTINRKENLTNIKENIDKENIDNNIIGEISRKGEKKEKSSTNSPKKEKNLEYIPIAERLAQIIQTNKNINITQSKLVSWADPIRKLNTLDKVALPRIEAALDWYSQNIGGPYIPVIESGNSLREKFIRLEDAIKRAGGSTTHSNPSRPSISPRKLFQDELGSLSQAFERNCYEITKQRVPGPTSRETKGELAMALVKLYQNICDRQRKIPEQTFKLFPQYGPISLIQTYLERLPDSPWSEWKQRRIFDIEAGWFQNFCSEYAFENGDSAIHPLSGKPLRS